MIKIRAKRYKKEDYESLRKVIVNGIKAFNCREQIGCGVCPHRIVCNDLDYLLEYLRDKIKELSENVDTN